MITRICKICGKKYKVCPTCEGIKTFTPWRTLVCDPQEFMLFEILSRHTLDHNSVVAAERIRTLEFSSSRIKSFLPEIQDQMKAIQKDAQDSKSTNKQKIEETHIAN